MNLVGYAVGLLIVVALVIQAIQALSDALGGLFGAIGQALLLVVQVGITFLVILTLLLIWRWMLPFYRGSVRGLRTSPASRVALGRDDKLARRADTGSLSGLLPVRVTLQPEVPAEADEAEKETAPRLRRGPGNSWRHAGDWSPARPAAGDEARPIDVVPGEVVSRETSGSSRAFGVKLWPRRSPEGEHAEEEGASALAGAREEVDPERTGSSRLEPGTDSDAASSRTGSSPLVSGSPAAPDEDERPLPRRRVGQSGAAQASVPLRSRASRLLGLSGGAKAEEAVSSSSATSAEAVPAERSGSAEQSAPVEQSSSAGSPSSDSSPSPDVTPAGATASTGPKKPEPEPEPIAGVRAPSEAQVSPEQATPADAGSDAPAATGPSLPAVSGAVPQMLPTPARPKHAEPTPSSAVPVSPPAAEGTSADEELDREDEQTAGASDGPNAEPVPSPVSALRRKPGDSAPRRPQEPYDPSKNPYQDGADDASNDLPVPRLSQLLSQSRRRVKDRARKVGRFLPGGDSSEDEVKPEKADAAAEEAHSTSVDRERADEPGSEHGGTGATALGAAVAGAVVGAAGAGAAKARDEESNEEKPRPAAEDAQVVRERRPSLREVMMRPHDRAAEASPEEKPDGAEPAAAEVQPESRVQEQPKAQPELPPEPQARWQRGLTGEQPVVTAKTSSRAPQWGTPDRTQDKKAAEPEPAASEPDKSAASVQDESGWAEKPFTFFRLHDEVGPDDEGAVVQPPVENDEARAVSPVGEHLEGPDESTETAAEIAAAADLAESAAGQPTGAHPLPKADQPKDAEPEVVEPKAAEPEDATAGDRDSGGEESDKAAQRPEPPITPRSIPGQRERVLLNAAPDLPELTPRKSPPRPAQPHQLSTYTYRNELPHLDLETRLADEAVCQAALDLAASPEDEAARQLLLESLVGDGATGAESRTLLQVTALRGSGGVVAEFLDGLVLMRDLNARAFPSAPAPVPGVIATSSRAARTSRIDHVYAVTPDRAARDLLSGVPGFTRALANWAMIADDEDRPDLEAAFQRAVANMPMELLDAIRHAIKLAPPLPGVPLRVDRLTGVVTTLPEEQATEVPGEGFPAEWRRSERRFYQ